MQRRKIVRDGTIRIRIVSLILAVVLVISGCIGFNSGAVYAAEMDQALATEAAIVSDDGTEDEPEHFSDDAKEDEPEHLPDDAKDAFDEQSKDDNPEELQNTESEEGQDPIFRNTLRTNEAQNADAEQSASDSVSERIYNDADGVTKYDFRDDITEVTLTFNGVTMDLDTVRQYEGPITEDANFDIRLQYFLKSGTLVDSEGNPIRTITYDAPDALMLKDVESGDIRNDANVRIGTYTIKNNKVSITFLENIARGNAQEGQAIEGFISWSASISTSQVTEEGKAEIDIDGIHQITLTYFQIEKSGSMSEDKQSIRWTVLLNEYGADMEGYTLSDVMYETKLVNKKETESAVTDYNPSKAILMDSNGTEYSINLPYTFTDGSDGIDPKGRYTMIYDTDLNDLSYGANGLRNRVELSRENHTIGDDASVKVNVLNPISKSGGKDADISYSEDGLTAYIRYKMVLKTPEGRVIPGPWVVEDWVQYA